MTPLVFRYSNEGFQVIRREHQGKGFQLPCDNFLEEKRFQKLIMVIGQNVYKPGKYCNSTWLLALAGTFKPIHRQEFVRLQPHCMLHDFLLPSGQLEG